MIDRVGDEFDALIISTTRFGFFVELEDMFIEGLVPHGHAAGRPLQYHENMRKIIGERSRRQYSIGDKVQCAAGSGGRRREEIAVFVRWR